MRPLFAVVLVVESHLSAEHDSFGTLEVHLTINCVRVRDTAFGKRDASKQTEKTRNRPSSAAGTVSRCHAKVLR
jgi:hypothetical protein